MTQPPLVRRTYTVGVVIDGHLYEFDIEAVSVSDARATAVATGQHMGNEIKIIGCYVKEEKV